MEECNYPDCFNCTKDDCDMTEYDIKILNKVRREVCNLGEQKQKKKNTPKKKVDINLPKCDKCRRCITVQKEKANGTKRLCLNAMRLIEQSVVYCPDWCNMIEK